MTMLMDRALSEDTIRGYMTRALPDGELEFTAVTAGVKRDGLDIDLAGLSVDNFMRNPVFLWVHDYAGRIPPIGRVTAITRGEDRLIARVSFDMADPFAAEIQRKYVAGFMNAVSIGWDTLDSDGSRITESDLLDISAVPVPGDQDALLLRAEAYARSLRGEPTIASDSTQAVSEDTPDPRALRGTVIEQIDQAAAALTALRDTLAEDPPPEPPPEVPPEAPPAPDLGPVLQALGESND